LDHDTAKPIVERIARRLHAENRSIDQDDIESEIWAEVTRQWATIEPMPDEDRPRLISFVADRAGAEFCSRERQYYQHFTAEWIYTPQEIRRLLVDFFDADAWLSPVKRPEGTNQTLLGDGLTIALIDVDRAYQSLSETDQQIIMRVYQARESLDRNGAERKRLNRAVDRIVAFLNRAVSERFDHSDHEGPGSRDVMSNATARALTHENY
jgi:hypothetical protein